MSIVPTHEPCAACGHDRVFHQVGTGNGVPAGVPFCDDRHGPRCSCIAFVSVDSRVDREARAGKAVPEVISHPAHYGGDTPYEAIKVIEAWGLGFCLGNTVKYISRAGKKDPARHLEDLRKARWYLDREIATHEKAGK
jgi:hypothetical protein